LKVILGTAVSPVGLKGQFKCKLYSPIPTWKSAKITTEIGDLDINLVKHPYGNKPYMCLCGTPKIGNRQDVSTVLNRDIWITRENLPPTKAGEVYYFDLMGLEVVQNGKKLGKLTDVYNFGAGDVLRLDTGVFVHWDEVESCDNGVIEVNPEVMI